MSSSNADLVREAFERWSHDDHEWVLAHTDPDAVIQVASQQLTGGEPFRGHEGYRQWLATMRESFELWQIAPESFREHGDNVIVLGQMHVRGRGSGIELDQETGWVIEVRDGKVTRFRAFFTHEEALAAGGIS
jgi:ketosteroid isomerase-like protein